MAILAISRQMSAVNENLIKKIAEILGYKYIDRKMIRERMEKNGYPSDKFNKYDEVKPSFFSFFSKDRENYVNYLKEAICCECINNDMKCVFAGRAAFHILKDIPSCVSVRLVANGWTRLNRAKEEFGLDAKGAKKKLLRSEIDKFGYYKMYFKLKLSDTSIFDLVLDTTNMTEDEIIKAIINCLKSKVSEADEENSREKVNSQRLGYLIVTLLFNAYDVNVSNLTAEVTGKTVTLNGITDTSGTIEYIKKILSCEMPAYEIVSNISAVQDSMSPSRR